MKKTKFLMKCMSMFLIVCMVVTSMEISFAAESSDVNGHWAANDVSSWIEKGLANGYNDGTFKPDNSITRAEFMTLVNKGFKLDDSSEIDFVDVNSNDWYSVEVKKAKAANYISGYEDKTIRPNNKITRQEVASIISRLLKLETDTKVDVANKFNDSTSIPNWSKGSIGALVDKNYMGGYPDGSYGADKSITRAEAIVTLNRIFKNNEIKTIVLDKYGKYGPDSGMEIIDTNVTISSADVTLQNTIIKGNLVLGEGIRDGNAYLNNVIVKGDTIINGGGEHSIIVKNSELGIVIVNKKDGEVRIVIEGNTKINEVRLESGAKLEEDNATGAGFGNVVVTYRLPKNAKVLLSGSFDKVEVEAERIEVEVVDGEIFKLDITDKAASTTVDIDSNSKVSKLTLDSKVSVTGKGNIDTANINVKDVKIEQSPKSVEVKKDITANIGGKDVYGYTPSSSSGGRSYSSGGASSTPTTIAVSGVTVIASDSRIPNGGTLQLNANLQPSNATNKTITWSVISGTGSATIDANGLLTATKVGTVTVTATNGASGITATKEITVIRVDKTELTVAITTEVGVNHGTPVYGLTSTDYTVASWTEYTNAVAAAIIAEANANAMQSAIDSALAEIAVKKAALVFANKVAMEAAVIAANAKVEADYTTASWTQFASARSTALAMPAITNTEMGAKLTAINEAIALLKIDKTGLAAAITTEVGVNHGTPVYVLTSTDYTVASWTEYTNAVAAAIIAEANANAVQSTIDSVLGAILARKTALTFANKAAMEAAVIAVNAKVEADYTTASWTQFASARSTALAMPAITNTEMGAKLTAINEAIALLKIDKTGLAAAITTEVGVNHGTPVYVLTSTDYTVASWTEYTNAVAAAIIVEANANAVQSAIDSALAAISEKKTALTFANKAAMEAAVIAANAKVEADYTTASWTQFASARSTALAMQPITNTEMGAKLTAINEAIALLKIDKKGLAAAITTEVGVNHGTPVYVLTSTDYTVASWTEYTNAVAAAIIVEANANAVQSAIDSASAAIAAKKTALIFANKAAMDAAVIAANAKVQADYTTASWTQFASARSTALAMQPITNAEMGAKLTAINEAIKLLIEAVQETLSSISITNLDYSTSFATQAKIESKVISTSNFDKVAGKNKIFTVTDSSGNAIVIDLWWNIPALVNDQPSTYATVVGSAVESYIQQYFVDKGGVEALRNRTLWASGSGDKFSIYAYGEGPTGKITITGKDASYFFDTLQATGTGEDHSKNRTFTIHDGTSTATIILDTSYTDMAKLVKYINSRLTTSQASVVKIDETHFKLVTKIKGIHLIIGGANKADFFSSFESE